MIIAIPKEIRKDESRVAVSPESVKKFIALGFKVQVEKGAGVSADMTDAAYKEAGAEIIKTAKALYENANIVLKVNRPLTKKDPEKKDEMGLIKSGTHLVCLMDPYGEDDLIKEYAKANIHAFSLEFVPRISRAQSMDVLSSQSNLAGYKAVIDAAATYGRAFPMMMTAAGTVAPAKVMVMGAGVAGLQAIATARRLGGVVCATDVRMAAKEQVESLGASFVMVEDDEVKQAETAGGYAKEMSDAYKQKQAALIEETLTKQDVAITTALIPGRPAPILITKAMVEKMATGSVIVDLAAPRGGNCELTKPGKAVVTKNGVTILAPMNIVSGLANDASALFARNVYNFVDLLFDADKKKLNIDFNDEIIKGSCLTYKKKVVHELFAPKKAKKTLAKKKSTTKKKTTTKKVAKKTKSKK